MFGGHLARASASTGCRRTKASPPARSCSPNISTAIALQSNASHLVGSAAWLNFRRIKCERWTSGNVILLGDAAHTAHFSIGSGTKLALEDAIKLARGAATATGLSLEAALDEYQAERNLEVLKLQNSARNSTEWFETLDRYLHFEPLQFAYSLLTRSQRISHENLRLRDREWLEGVERWFWENAPASAGQDRGADVRAVQAARDDAREPHHRLADGDVFGGRRHAQRLPLRPLSASARSAAPGWCSPR